MRYGSRIRWFIGPIAVSLALGGGGCNGPMAAFADDGEVVPIESLEDTEEPLVSLADTEQDAQETGQQPQEGEREYSSSPEPQEVEQESQEGEQEPQEALPEGEVEGEQEPQQTETGATIDDVAEQLEQLNATVEAVAAHVDELETRPLEQMAMISTGALGALLGSVAFGGMWRVMGGES